MSSKIHPEDKEFKKNDSGCIVVEYKKHGNAIVEETEGSEEATTEVDTEDSNGFLRVMNNICKMYNTLYDDKKIDLQGLLIVDDGLNLKRTTVINYLDFDENGDLQNKKMKVNTLEKGNGGEKKFSYCKNFENVVYKDVLGKFEIRLSVNSDPPDDGFEIEVFDRQTNHQANGGNDQEESVFCQVLYDESGTDGNEEDIWDVENFASLFDSYILVADGEKNDNHLHGIISNPDSLIFGFNSSLWIFFFNSLVRENSLEPYACRLKLKNAKQLIFKDDIPRKIKKVHFTGHQIFLVKSQEEDPIEIVALSLKDTLQLRASQKEEVEFVEIELAEQKSDRLPSVRLDASRFIKFEEKYLKQYFGENSIVVLDKKTREIIEIVSQHNPKELVTNVIVTEVKTDISRIVCTDNKKFIVGFGMLSLEIWAKIDEKYESIYIHTFKTKVLNINFTADMVFLIAETEEKVPTRIPVNLPRQDLYRIFTQKTSSDLAELSNFNFTLKTQTDSYFSLEDSRLVKFSWDEITKNPLILPSLGFKIRRTVYLEAPKELVLIQENSSLKEILITYYSVIPEERFKVKYTHKVKECLEIVESKPCRTVLIMRMKGEEGMAKVYDLETKVEIEIEHKFSRDREELEVLKEQHLVIIQKDSKRVMFVDLPKIKEENYEKANENRSTSYLIEKFEILGTQYCKNVLMLKGTGGIILFVDGKVAGTHDLRGNIDQIELCSEATYISMIKGGICTLHLVQGFSPVGMLITDNSIDMNIRYFDSKGYLFVLHNSDRKRTTTVFDLSSKKILYNLPASQNHLNSLNFLQFRLEENQIKILSKSNPIFESCYPLSDQVLVPLIKYNISEYYKTDSVLVRQTIVRRMSSIARLATSEGGLLDRLLLLFVFMFNHSTVMKSYLSLNNIERLFSSCRLMTMMMTAGHAQASKKAVLDSIKSFREKRKRYFPLDSEEFERAVILHKERLIKDETDQEILRLLLLSPIEDPVNCQLKDSFEFMGSLDFNFEGFNHHTLHSAVAKTSAELVMEVPVSISKHQTCASLVKLNLGNGSEFSRSIIQVLRAVSDEELKTNMKYIVYYKWSKIYWKMALPYAVLFWLLAVLAYSFFGYQETNVLLGVVVCCLDSLFLVFEIKCLISEGSRYYFELFWNWVDILIHSGSITAAVILLSHPGMGQVGKTWIRTVPVLVLWIRATTWLRVFRPIRYLVTMVMQVFIDIMPFLIILAATILGYSYLLRLSPGLYSAENEISEDFFPSFYDSVFIIFGDQPQNDEKYKSLFVVVLIGNVILALALLNFLIAIISGTFETINNERDLYDTKEILSLIRDFDSFSAGFRCFKKGKQPGEHFITLRPFVESVEESGEETQVDLEAFSKSNLFSGPGLDQKVVKGLSTSIEILNRSLADLHNKIDRFTNNSKISRAGTLPNLQEDFKAKGKKGGRSTDNMENKKLETAMSLVAQVEELEG